MAVYFIADTHFGHLDIIKHCNRPFNNADEMNRILRKNWNERVKDNDDVYIVGDFCFRTDGVGEAIAIAKSLRGRKYLIIGNHDEKMLKDARYRECFVEICDIGKITLDGERIVMCHYPIAEWDGFFRGSWHIYGHIHNARNQAFATMRAHERALNAGADITNFAPVTFSELKTLNQIYNQIYNK
ncbi:MAG: metallophosphoesterase family protein [Defluviitaleaceae bacterium]|nr:metallophosphoesterase family protein [Defluviitaleaceae bacterium]